MSIIKKFKEYYESKELPDPKELTSLEGCPRKVGGDFTCSTDQLTSLEGCPREIGGKPTRKDYIDFILKFQHKKLFSNKWTEEDLEKLSDDKLKEVFEKVKKSAGFYKR